MRWLVVLGMLLLLLVACTGTQQAIPVSAPAAQPSNQTTPHNTTAAPPATHNATTPAPQPAPAHNATVPKPAPVNATVKNTTLQGNQTHQANLNATNNSTKSIGCYGPLDDKDHFTKYTTEYVVQDQDIVKVDECAGTALIKWYCGNDGLTKKIIVCQYGCNDGACLRQNS